VHEAHQAGREALLGLHSEEEVVDGHAGRDAHAGPP
jgi:hypothetical protein